MRGGSCVQKHSPPVERGHHERGAVRLAHLGDHLWGRQIGRESCARIYLGLQPDTADAAIHR